MFSMVTMVNSYQCSSYTEILYFSFKPLIKIRMVNSVDPDETARDEPSYLDLHCLHMYCFWSAGLQGGLSQTIATCLARTAPLVDFRSLLYPTSSILTPIK